MLRLAIKCYNQVMKNSPKLSLKGPEKETSNYRETALRELKHKCADCDITDLLVVHHKNGRKAGDGIENLELVCHNHHGIRHMKQVARGKWVYSSHSRTPRSKLSFLRKKILKE